MEMDFMDRSGNIPPTSQGLMENLTKDQQPSRGNVHTVDPVINISRGKAEEKQDSPLSERKVSKEKSLGPSVIKAPKHKKPHDNYGYMGGGAAAMMAGASILALVPPVAVIGIPIFVMGLMAFAYSFCNFDQPQQEFNNQQQENDKKQRDKDDKDKRDKDKSSSGNAISDEADGKFIGRPVVDFSGGKVKFPPNNPQPIDPPPFKEGYVGPNWEQIYNAATMLGMPPVPANQFMNACFEHLGDISSQPDNSKPEDVLNMPLAMEYANKEQLTAGDKQGKMPKITGIDSMFSPPAIVSDIGSSQESPVIINEIYMGEEHGSTHEDNDSLTQEATLPLNMKGVIPAESIAQIKEKATRIEEKAKKESEKYFDDDH
ncbi:MAG: hypothetical protein PUP46_07865 [Endozoicomonas sp. (ex Botrylloides leachii)]|nr:hypothetical protein [Endozoicomonas sp. (ex Botrylloides leachii)]